MNKIFIEISRTCQKSCYYCYNSKKTREDIKPDTKNIIKSIKLLGRGSRTLNLIFSGGESTNRLKEIEEIIVFLTKDGYKIIPTLITNTDHIDKHFKKFIAIYKPYIVLSYNKRTFYLAKSLIRLLPQKNIFIRFTITPENVIKIVKEIERGISRGYYVGISPAYGVEWDDTSLKALQMLYFRLAENENRRMIYDFEKIKSIRKKSPRPCQSLKKANAIDFNGDIHPCHRAIYFSDRSIYQSRFTDKCKRCIAYRYCTPCIFKGIPGDGCKIRVAIASIYELLYKSRRFKMKRKITIHHKGKKYEIPEAVLKRYSKPKKKNSPRKSSRNFYELGESDCY